MFYTAHKRFIFLLAFVMACILTATDVSAQSLSQDPVRRYKVVDGVLTEIGPDTTAQGGITSMVGTAAEGAVDQTTVDEADSLTRKEIRAVQKEMEAMRRAQDTVRYSRIFRDTIPLSKMVAISVVVPGFGQLYNNQAWKIPILYGTVGAAAYFGFKQNSKFRNYRNQYNDLVSHNAPREEIEPVQNQMMKHNTARTVLFVGALASYVYFIGDGAFNYTGPVNTVKKATTLSTIFPGAGQVYNRSYWKVPIVIGAFATMGYVIDFNNRGYKRFQTAFNLATDGDDTTVDEFKGRYSADFLRTLRNNYRRNRDLSIIVTVGLYLLNIVDAHVDAHFKDFDISDDLAMTLEPTMMNYYTMRRGNVNGAGMSLKIAF